MGRVWCISAGVRLADGGHRHGLVWGFLLFLLRFLLIYLLCTFAFFWLLVGMSFLRRQPDLYTCLLLFETPHYQKRTLVSVTGNNRARAIAMEHS